MIVSVHTRPITGIYVLVMKQLCNQKTISC